MRFNSEFVRKWMDDQQRSNRWLADNAGLSMPTVKRYVEGSDDHEQNSLRTIEKIAAAIGVSGKSLILEEEKEPGHEKPA